MPDFLLTDIGANLLQNDGWPGTVEVGLARAAVADLTAVSTLSSINEVHGTGYVREVRITPPASNREIRWAQCVFDTGDASDWPADVKSSFVTANGDLLAVWDLPRVRDMSQPDTRERVTPIFAL